MIQPITTTCDRSPSLPLLWPSRRESHPPRRGPASTKGWPPTGEETRMFKVVEAVFYVAGALLITAQVASIITLANHM